jgi:hypothetical protein
MTECHRCDAEELNRAASAHPTSGSTGATRSSAFGFRSRFARRRPVIDRGSAAAEEHT